MSDSNTQSCKCICHTLPRVKHFRPCCDNTYVLNQSLLASLRKSLLQRIADAGDVGVTLTKTDIHGSTFEDLWGDNMIAIKGQEGSLLQRYDFDSVYILTDAGRSELQRLTA